MYLDWMPTTPTSTRPQIQRLPTRSSYVHQIACPPACNNDVQHQKPNGITNTKQYHQNQTISTNQQFEKTIAGAMCE